MRNSFELLFLLIFILNSCATSSSKSQDVIHMDDFMKNASEYLIDYNSDCLQENGSTWGHTLCVPMIIVDRDTLNAISNKPDPAGKFENINGIYFGKYSGPSLSLQRQLMEKFGIYS